jgi:D-arabinose 1-dehydrogenase-like Zn-dependent alcohol dehydrogenase
MTPSHEPAGIVVALGSNVESKWKIGQHVGVINFRNPCGTCAGCQWHSRDYDGRLDARYCENKTMSGITEDGGFAQYMVAATYAMVALPEGLELKQAAPLMCAGVMLAFSYYEKIAALTHPFYRLQHGMPFRKLTFDPVAALLSLALVVLEFLGFSSRRL